MRFAIAIPTDAESWRVVRRAEELGFTRAWFYDTQMLSADCFGGAFAHGKAMLLRRDLLAGRGGLRALSSELAEDSAATASLWPRLSRLLIGCLRPIYVYGKLFSRK